MQKKEPSKKTVIIFKSIMLRLNLNKFVKFSETLAVRKPMPVGLRFRLMNLTHKAKRPVKSFRDSKEIYSKAYPNQQVALYVHNDTQSLHVHAVIGAINLETGKKMHGNWHEYRERLIKITDKVVKSHGLSITVPQKRPEKRSMAEIKMKAKGQMTWKDQIRNAIDTTMSDARIIDFKSFKDKLTEKAVNVYERGKRAYV